MKLELNTRSQHSFLVLIGPLLLSLGIVLSPSLPLALIGVGSVICIWKFGIKGSILSLVALAAHALTNGHLLHHFAILLPLFITWLSLDEFQAVEEETRLCHAREKDQLEGYLTARSKEVEQLRSTYAERETKLQADIDNMEYTLSFLKDAVLFTEDEIQGLSTDLKSALSEKESLLLELGTRHQQAESEKELLNKVNALRTTCYQNQQIALSHQERAKRLIEYAKNQKSLVKELEEHDHDLSLKLAQAEEKIKRLESVQEEVIQSEEIQEEDDSTQIEMLEKEKEAMRLHLLKLRSEVSDLQKSAQEDMTSGALYEEKKEALSALQLSLTDLERELYILKTEYQRSQMVR